MNNQSIRKASAECNCAPRRLLLLLLLRGARLVFISSFYTGLRVVTRSTTPFCIILCTHKYSIYGVRVSFYNIIRSTYNYIYDVIRITASYVYNVGSVKPLRLSPAVHSKSTNKQQSSLTARWRHALQLVDIHNICTLLYIVISTVKHVLHIHTHMQLCYIHEVTLWYCWYKGHDVHK